MDIMRIAGSGQLVRYCNTDAGVTYTVDAGYPPRPAPRGERLLMHHPSHKITT
jgi:hypothetical protein